MKLLCAELNLNCVAPFLFPTHSYILCRGDTAQVKIAFGLDFRLQREIYIPICNVAGNATSPYTTTFTVQVAAGYVDLTCDYISQEVRISFWFRIRIRILH